MKTMSLFTCTMAFHFITRSWSNPGTYPSSFETSNIPFLSSVHGRERRYQRDISKRDLQSAVQNGKKEEASANPTTGEKRFKYTYADIVYITDESSTREITSWALPVPFQALEISKSLAIQYVEAKRRLGYNNQIITSHAVFIVDMSGSMRNSDMIGPRSRYQGA